jgi:hypothetical protein
MSAHSLFGASAAHIWTNCTAQPCLASQAKTFEESSDYANEGTTAHNIAAEILKGVLPLESIGNLPDEMIDAITTYVKYVRRHVKKTSKLYVEQRIRLDSIDGGHFFGTADAIVSSKKTLTIIDFKYGQGISVQPENNPQLLYYLLGAIELEGLDIMCGKKFYVAIVQPRMEKDPIRKVEVPARSLIAFQAFLEGRYEKVKEDPEYRQGPWCQFCKVKGVCPELKRISNVTTKTDIEGDVTSLPEVEQLSMDTISKVLENASAIKKWLTAVETYGYNLALEGCEIPRHKLVLGGRATRKWINESKVAEELQSEYGLDIFDIKLKSPAQMEKLVDDKEVVQQYVMVPEKKPVLVSDTDKREPYNLGNELTSLVEQGD